LLITLIEMAEKLRPHSASVAALTLGIETQCTCISVSLPARAFSEPA
jgi:hypothetical protein